MTIYNCSFMSLVVPVGNIIKGKMYIWENVARAQPTVSLITEQRPNELAGPQPSKLDFFLALVHCFVVSCSFHLFDESVAPGAHTLVRILALPVPSSLVCFLISKMGIVLCTS